MLKQLRMLWKRLSRSLASDPGRFAGGSAVENPLGLLAVEREELAARAWSGHDPDLRASSDKRGGETE